MQESVALGFPVFGHAAVQYIGKTVSTNKQNNRASSGVFSCTTTSSDKTCIIKFDDATCSSFSMISDDVYDVERAEVIEKWWVIDSCWRGMSSSSFDELLAPIWRMRDSRARYFVRDGP